LRFCVRDVLPGPPYRDLSLLPILFMESLSKYFVCRIVNAPVSSAANWLDLESPAKSDGNYEGYSKLTQSIPKFFMRPVENESKQTRAKGQDLQNHPQEIVTMSQLEVSEDLTKSLPDNSASQAFQAEVQRCGYKLDYNNQILDPSTVPPMVMGAGDALPGNYQTTCGRGAGDALPGNYQTSWGRGAGDPLPGNYQTDISWK
jgi:hypothetical protein